MTNNVISLEVEKEKREGIKYIDKMYAYYDEQYAYNGLRYDDVDLDLLDIED